MNSDYNKTHVKEISLHVITTAEKKRGHGFDGVWGKIYLRVGERKGWHKCCN